MKLVLAVVSTQAAEGITDALLAAGFRTTRLASTGGFRREGNTTVMMGVDDEDVEPVLAILRSGVHTAASRKAAAAAAQAAQAAGGEGGQVQPSGRGAVFVLPLEGYFHL
ncbi:MAG: cyclic-di-AMP receptor [Chloroflexi bacterium]|nr:cyclic-di-AMP receptor [Chloroflexota bacterium]